MTALDSKVRASGMVYQQLWVAHAVENGLGSPHMVLLDDDRLRLSLHEADADKWFASVEHISETVTPQGQGHEHVQLEAYLPLLRVRVTLRYTRRCAPAASHLRAVGA